MSKEMVLHAEYLCLSDLKGPDGFEEPVQLNPLVHHIHSACLAAGNGCMRDLGLSGRVCCAQAPHRLPLHQQLSSPPPCRACCEELGG